MLPFELGRRHIAPHAEGDHESHAGHGGDGVAGRHARTLRLAVLVDLAERRALDLLEGGGRVGPVVIVVVGVAAAWSAALPVAPLHFLVATVSTMIALRYLELLHIGLQAVEEKQKRFLLFIQLNQSCRVVSSKHFLLGHNSCQLERIAGQINRSTRGRENTNIFGLLAATATTPFRFHPPEVVVVFPTVPVELR